MKTRINTKSVFFLILFFFIFIFIPINSFTPYVSAGQTQVLGVDLLSISTGTFNDFTPGDTVRPIKSSVGGRDLLAFENLGMISYNEDTKTALYGGIITFGAEVNAYTGVVCEDAYPVSGGSDFNKITYQTFLSYQTWRHANLLGLSCSNPLAVHFAEIKDPDKTFVFQINYREIEYGTLYSHDYDGTLPFKINLDPGLFLSKLGELEVGGQTFTVPTIVSDIRTIKEVAKRGGEVGSYEDRFTGEDEGLDEVMVEVTLSRPSWDSTVNTLAEWFNENMEDALVVDPIPLPEDYPTIQQSVRDLTLNEYPSAGIQDYIEVPYRVHIRPEMKRIPQTIHLKHGNFHWWKCGCGWRQGPTVTTNTYERNLGMHVYNVFVHTDFEIKVDVVMTCEFDAELSESFLEDPNLIISDRIWDGAIYGTSEVKIKLPLPAIEWWMWILIILIVVIAVYIGYKLLSIYLRSRKKAVQIIMRR